MNKIRFNLPPVLIIFSLFIFQSFLKETSLCAAEVDTFDKKLQAVSDSLSRYDKTFLKTRPFDLAELYFHAGDGINAKIYYQKYLAAGLDESNVDQAIFRLAQLDFRSRYYVTSLRYLNYLIDRFPKTPNLLEVKFMMGVCNFEIGNLDKAREIFENQAKINSDPSVRWNISFYLSRLDEKSLNYAKALVRLRKIYQNSPDDETRMEAFRLTQRIIDEKFPTEDLALLIRKFGDGFPVDLMLWRLISIYRLERKNASYLSTIQKFIKLFPNHQKRGLAEKYLEQAQKNISSIFKIGAILPLTGKHALTGQKVLQGVQLAFNQLNSINRGKIELEVKDSGVAGSLVAATEELASDPNVLGVVGPVLSNRVKDVIPLAKDYQLPLFTPTATISGLPELSPFIYRNALTRKMQANFIARYAVNDLNLKRFVVFFPDETFGEELRIAFSEEVHALGAEIIANVSYDRAQTDFKKQILSIGGVSDSELKKLTLEKLTAEQGEKNNLHKRGVPFSRPIVEKGVWNEQDVEGLKVTLELSYDAIFIPGFYDKVALIVPQLAFYNLDRVTLLGTSGWNHPELLKSAGKFLNNRGIFVDGFFKDSMDERVQDFVHNFKSTFGEEPSIYSAQAYDTARIFLDMIARGVVNRLEMQSSLFMVKNFPGVSGESIILSSGETKKKLFALKIRRNKIVQIN